MVRFCGRFWALLLAAPILWLASNDSANGQKPPAARPKAGGLPAQKSPQQRTKALRASTKGPTRRRSPKPTGLPG